MLRHSAFPSQISIDETPQRCPVLAATAVSLGTSVVSTLRSTADFEWEQETPVRCHLSSEHGA